MKREGGIVVVEVEVEWGGQGEGEAPRHTDKGVAGGGRTRIIRVVSSFDLAELAVVLPDSGRSGVADPGLGLLAVLFVCVHYHANIQIVYYGMDNVYVCVVFSVCVCVCVCAYVAVYLYGIKFCIHVQKRDYRMTNIMSSYKCRVVLFYCHSCFFLSSMHQTAGC